jgi:hypothetical protein
MYVHMIGHGEEDYEWIVKFAVRLAVTLARGVLRWPSNFVGM